MKSRVRQYRGVYDPLATYRRLSASGVLGSHSYLHISSTGAEIGWSPTEHQCVPAAEFESDWRARMERIAGSSGDVGRKAFGYIGFDVVDGISAGRPDGSTESQPPLLEMIVPGELLVFGDGGSVAHHSTSGLDVHRYLTVRLPPVHSASPVEELVPVATTADRLFIDNVQCAKQKLQAGELHKVVLSRYQAFDVVYDPISLFAAHCLSRPFIDAILISFGDTVAIIASPELLLDARARQIVSNPLAGTRPRGKTIDQDEQLRSELMLDHKEIVEHVLSVTTMLGQLEPLCEPETLVVNRLMEVHVQQHVQHLSSVLRAQLSPDCHVLEALWTLFPSVTIAGFPKSTAVQLLRELEGGPRCMYAGAAGWVSGSGDCHFSLAIRSIFRYGTRTFLHAGAGIMAESVPESELLETTHKLANTREALNWAVAHAALE